MKKSKAIRTIRDATVDSLYHLIDDYSDWYDQEGLYLPPDFATRPSDWCEVLHQIRRAFKLLHDEVAREGELWEARENPEKTKELEEEIKKGFELFGKYLFYLTDLS